MAQQESTPPRPFTTFNFRVRIETGDGPLCDAAFTECSGLEVTMEPETHREGGQNATQYQLMGPVSYGQVTLKRGMTNTFDLWRWFNQVTAPEGYRTRARVVVEVLSSDRNGRDSPVKASFTLRKCLPVKLRAPSLDATDGGVAIEEMQIAYERINVEIPGASSDEVSGPISRVPSGSSE